MRTFIMEERRRFQVTAGDWSYVEAASLHAVVEDDEGLDASFWRWCSSPPARRRGAWAAPGPRAADPPRPGYEDVGERGGHAPTLRP